MPVYKDFRMRELFMNPALAGVFPQFSKDEKLQNVYSFARNEKRVQDYLVAALNGKVLENGTIVVRGKQKSVLQKVRQMNELITSFINNMPKVVQALRNDTPIYLPFENITQIQRINSPFGKEKAMRAVMDNFQYNADLGALNSVKKETSDVFLRKQRAWEKKVGYRRLKKV